jgi:peptide/nickel transport system substrate-binding protein
MEDVRASRDGIRVDGLSRMLRDGKITRRGFLVRAAGLVGSLAAAEGLLARVVGAQTTSKTDLVIAQGGDISKFDPHLSTTVYDTSVTFNLYDNLLNRHRDGKLYPSLATEWKLVSPTMWQFKLRSGVKFHTGDPLTSADVKFSLDRAIDPKAGSRVNTVFTTVDRIETPDSQSVNFHTKQPDPLLAARLAFYGGQIMPKAYFEKLGPDEFNAKPIGSGPVKFVSWVKDDHLVLDANRDYWGGKIDADRVVFRPIVEGAPRIAALLKGEVDLITKLPPDDVERVAKHPTTRVEGALYAGLYVLAVGSQRPPLNNVKVRQALSLAVDREAIVKDMWRGQGIVPNGPIAKGDNHYDESLPPLKYDPDRARRLLKEGKYQGEEIVLESTSGFLANDKSMSEALVGMWRDVGLNVRMEVMEYSVRMQKMRDKTFKGLLWSDPTSTVGDPDGMMWRHLAPGGNTRFWQFSTRFDELGNAARISIEEKFRGQAYKEMTQIILEEVPWIPIIQPIESYGVQKYLDWLPYSNQQLEVRRFNLKFRRA